MCKLFSVPVPEIFRLAPLIPAVVIILLPSKFTVPVGEKILATERLFPTVIFARILKLLIRPSPSTSNIHEGAARHRPNQPVAVNTALCVLFVFKTKGWLFFEPRKSPDDRLFPPVAHLSPLCENADILMKVKNKANNIAKRTWGGVAQLLIMYNKLKFILCKAPNL